MELPERFLEVAYIEEPDLAFGYGQISDHPKDGLFLYGPHAGPSRSKEITIGVVGTKDGLSFFRKWAIRLGGFVACRLLAGGKRKIAFTCLIFLAWRKPLG